MIMKLTKEQAAIIVAYTGYAAGPFGDIQEYAERKLGRSIFTHEFASPDLAEELKDAAKADFVSICYDSKK